MSEFHAQKTLYKDAECLIHALKAQGYCEIEVHEHAQQLYDYQGRATHYLDPEGDKGHIIVRRHIVGGAANDLAFRKNVDGTFDAIVSQFEQHKHNADWMKSLKKSYTEAVDMKLAKKHGLKFLGRKVVGGRVQLQFLDTRG